MGIFDIFKTTKNGHAVSGAEYDSIDAVAVQTNLLVATESTDRQAAIRKLAVGSLVNLKPIKRKGQNIYVVTDCRNNAVVGEISYGTSDYLAQNFKGHKMLGKVAEIGKLTPMGSGKQVRIEYKVYL